MEQIKETELQIVKTQSTKALATAQEVKITSQEKFEEANLVKDKIVAARKLVKAKKEEITKPLNEGLKQVRALFAPIEETIDEAEIIVKKKISEYITEQENKVKEAQKKIAEQVQKKDIEIDKGLEKMDKVQEKFVEKTNIVRTRINRVVKVVNESEIPEEYWVLDMVRVRADALSGVLTKGVEVIEEKIIL